MNPHENDNPTPRHDEADALFDANLRAFGTKIGPLPAHAALRLAGTQAVAPRPARHPRWLAWGSAMAACIAAGAVIFSQPWGNRVEASTIIGGLRTKEFGGVNIVFDRVSSQGTTIDGVVRMRLKDPISIDRLDDPKAIDSNARLGAAYGKFTLTSDPIADGGEPSVIDAEGSLTPASGWMYVRASDGAARQMAEGNPMAGAVAGLAQHGVVLNIGSLDDRFFDGLNAMVCPASRQSSDLGGLHTSVERTADGHGKVSVGLRVPTPGSPSAEQFSRLIGYARMVLSGKARQNELEQMRSMLQNDFAQKATVQTLGAGRFLLTTNLPPPSEGASAVSGGMLRVLYEQSGGVRWAEFSGMPDTAGTIRVEFDSEPIDPSLLGYERLVNTGTTNYLDLRVIMRMFMPPLLRAW
ncbi:MAG TPA: hypothetical protein PKE29_03890 [Phycisphaerales bacterium]|nr:hypothetical protein [Phycisphaerales bacterium]